MNTDGVDHKVRNRHLVESLERSLRSGKHGLSVVPGLLKQVLVEESWREFTTQRDELVQHARFIDFVTTPPLRGLGADLDLIRRVVGNDPEALDLLDRAMQNPVGGSSKIVLNHHIVNVENDQEVPKGNSAAYALRKLRKDAPDLHAEVLAGRLTAHAAMVRGGFRPRTFTIRADDTTSVARTLRKNLKPDQLAELAQLLAEEQ